MKDGTYERQGMVIRKPDVLARTHHHPARDVERIFTRGEHPCKPVERGAALASAHALVQRGYHVVVAIAATVVRSGDRAPECSEEFAFIGCCWRGEDKLDQRERCARVSSGECNNGG